MLRDLLTNRAILAGTAFFLMVVLGGSLYLTHVKRATEREVEQTMETLRKIKPTFPVQSGRKVEQPELNTVTQADVPTIEDLKSPETVAAEANVMPVDDAHFMVSTEMPDIPLEADIPETADFKTTPEGYPLMPYWDQPAERQVNWSLEHKLIDHVLVKLWRQGVQNFEGGSIDDTGRVRPHYTNTLYVEWDEEIASDGTKQMYISHFFGPAGVWIKRGIFDLPPPSIDLIDINSPEGQGIDPYAFLTSKELP